MTAMITLKEKIGYGLGDMASSMFWKLFGSYLMIFYTDVFGLPAAVVGTMFLITRVWDSAFDPIVGVIADRTQTRWGKFRPYLLYLAVPFALIGIFTFTTPELNDTGKLVYAYITYSLMMMVYSAINVPYASLLGVMSPDPKERNTLSTYRYDFCLYRQFYCFAALHADGQPVWWCRRRATGMDVECGGDCCDVCGSVLSLFRLDT